MTTVALVATCVAPAAGDEDATKNLPDELVVTGAVLVPDEQPAISATKKVRDVKANLEKFDLSCMAIAPFSKKFCVRDGSVQT
jgi:hypothetical protein